MQNDKNRQQQSGEQNDVTQNQNPTLQDPGAAVADYGRSGNLQGQEEGAQQGREGNSSIPMEEEDTIGNP